MTLQQLLKAIKYLHHSFLKFLFISIYPFSALMLLIGDTNNPACKNSLPIICCFPLKAESVKSFEDFRDSAQPGITVEN